MPRYRVEENADAYVITARVPGAAAADVETIVDGDKLVVNARRNWQFRKAGRQSIAKSRGRITGSCCSSTAA